MHKYYLVFFIPCICIFNMHCKKNVSANVASENVFPKEITNFEEYEINPVFKGTDINTWDELIRERGYILKESDGYHLWYTGYQKDWKKLKLGYATSADGIKWQRYAQNPVYDSLWTEDMMVIKDGDTYQMFAEGENDHAHRLSSKDKIHWTEHGTLNIKNADGSPLSEGPFGTPTVIKEDNTWYLFYERNDSAIWLATSFDLITWNNVQDEPVLKKGPESYDQYGIALNQIVRYNGKYYAYYHGTPAIDWSTWNVNIAVSDDKIHWTKYEHNPLQENNKSSGILVHDGTTFRLYTMHAQVKVHFQKKI